MAKTIADYRADLQASNLEREWLKQKLAEMEGLCHAAAAVLEMTDRVKASMKIPEQDQAALVRNGLAAMPVEGEAWRAVHLLLARQISVEHGAAKRPGISNDDRNYNTGREAALEDFQSVLMQVKASVKQGE